MTKTIVCWYLQGNYPSSALLPTFLGEASPTKIDNSKKVGTPILASLLLVADLGTRILQGFGCQGETDGCRPPAGAADRAPAALPAAWDSESKSSLPRAVGTFGSLPTQRVFHMDPLEVKLLAGVQKATKVRETN